MVGKHETQTEEIEMTIQEAVDAAEKNRGNFKVVSKSGIVYDCHVDNAEFVKSNTDSTYGFRSAENKRNWRRDNVGEARWFRLKNMTLYVETEHK